VGDKSHEYTYTKFFNDGATYCVELLFPALYITRVFSATRIQKLVVSPSSREQDGKDNYSNRGSRVAGPKGPTE
jgi:hypothetical protein